MTTFKLDTNQTTYDAEDIEFKLEDIPTVTNFTETPLGKFISEMILTVSSSPSFGILTIHVRSNSLDCSFKASDWDARTLKWGIISEKSRNGRKIKKKKKT